MTLKNRFEQLSIKDRRALLLGIIGVTVLVFYGFFWQPLQRDKAALHVIVSSLQADLHWMQDTAQTIRQLQQTSTAPAINTNNRQSLLGLIDSSTRQGSLSEAGKRIEPRGKNRVQVSFEQVSFTALLRWLGDLSQQHGVKVESVTLEQQRKADIVRARLMLVRAG